MKLLVLAAVCVGFLGLASAGVGSPPTEEEEHVEIIKDGGETKRSHDVPAWSVVGKWDAVHPAWSDAITIRADGTFARDKGPAGHWTLTGLGDHVVLVLAWDDWPAEILSLMTPDDLRGKARVGTLSAPLGEFSMHRTAPPAAAAKPNDAKGAQPAYEFKTWRQGEPALRLIRKEEGFCALTLVTGRFQGSGEAVSVYVGDDGYWYLAGKSQQEAVSAQCIVVRNHPSADR